MAEEFSQGSNGGIILSRQEWWNNSLNAGVDNSLKAGVVELFSQGKSGGIILSRQEWRNSSLKAGVA